MGEISKIYSSDQLLIRVGGRKGKTRAQINKMLENRKPGKKKPKNGKAQGRKQTKRNTSKYTTLDEVQKILKLSKNEVFSLIDNGQFPLFRLKGKKILFNRNDVKNYIKNSLS